MKVRNLGWAAALLLAAASPAAAQKKAAYTVKPVADAAPPKELAEPVRKLFDNGSVQLLDAKGAVLAEVWFVKELAVKATKEQVKNGLTYAEVPQTAVVGALRVPKQLSDYRKQKVPAGVYTLRLAIQPADGDHMGTAPYNEFLLASPAADDKKPATMEVKSLQELSAKTTDSHPAVFVLFPGKGAEAKPTLASKPGGHWVVFVTVKVDASGTKTTMPFALTLVGASSSA